MARAREGATASAAVLTYITYVKPHLAAFIAGGAGDGTDLLFTKGAPIRIGEPTDPADKSVWVTEQMGVDLLASGKCKPCDATGTILDPVVVEAKPAEESTVDTAPVAEEQA